MECGNIVLRVEVRAADAAIIGAEDPASRSLVDSQGISYRKREPFCSALGRRRFLFVLLVHERWQVEVARHGDDFPALKHEVRNAAKTSEDRDRIEGESRRTRITMLSSIETCRCWRGKKAIEGVVGRDE